MPYHLLFKGQDQTAYSDHSEKQDQKGNKMAKIVDTSSVTSINNVIVCQV